MDAMSHWQQLSAALDALLDLPPETRQSRLAEIAASDPAQAATLRDLLAAEAREGPLDRGLGTRVREALDERAAADAISATDIGEHIGAWKLLRPIGRGGMGELFLVEREGAGFSQRAALKRLKRGMDSEEILRRFLQERQILARLNHPNIAHIYGMEASGESHALVMELVEGPTLAERLESGPFPIDEALSLVRQIAEALEQAHERGIVHRDLKPQNIKMSREGKVKVLDFGLAKAMDPAAGASSAGDRARSPTLLNSPTLTAAGTQLGVILGTAAYMAPEQARGGAVDKRADIWAFGVVLLEMLTGRSLFASDTVTDTLAGVLKTEIDLAALPTETPAAIRRLLARLDPDAVGGAFLLGVNGLSVIGHGSSNSTAVANAIRTAAIGVRHDLVQELAAEFGDRGAVESSA